MMSYPLNGVFADGSGQVFWEDGGRVSSRGWRVGDDGKRSAVRSLRTYVGRVPPCNGSFRSSSLKEVECIQGHSRFGPFLDPRLGG
jgi:hypothetical protein